MAGKFLWKEFSNIDLSDQFFDSLKADYVEFPIWFQKKADFGEKALVFEDEEGIGAFVYLKREEAESIVLKDKPELPAINRIKIGTFKLSERFRGQRLGEGAIGVALWYWQKLNKFDEIYLTAFDKHEDLINLITRFGFVKVGYKDTNGKDEGVYVRSRKNVDYSDPYKCFPFLKPNFDKAGILPIADDYHDKLFPYSELAGQREFFETVAGNGMTKCYICSPFNTVYQEGMPVLVYRMYSANDGLKQYKSAVTSFCTITKMHIIKQNGVPKYSLEDFLRLSGNKTVLTYDELKGYYDNKNCVILEMVYNGFFGRGHNVNFRWLKDHGLFEQYPYQIEYTKEQFLQILTEGEVNVSNVIID